MIIEGYNSKCQAIRLTLEKNKILKLEYIDSPNSEQYILPGFIDVHTHGGYNSDFNDGTRESLINYLKHLPAEGTTTILGTAATGSDAEYQKAFKVAGDYIDNPQKGITKMFGIHSEGIFLSKEKKGAHNPKYFKKLNKSEIDRLIKISNNNFKYITYAIEETNIEITKYLKQKHIIASVGHSVASFYQVREHAKHGLAITTHTFNAMSGIDHRNPGIALEALLNDNLSSEIISDGVHVHPEVIRLLYKLKGAKNIIVITDSASPKGMPDGSYMFLGYKIKKNDNMIINELGALAGSISSMISNFKNIIKFTDCSLEEAELMTSTNAAKLLGIDNRLGKIEKGYIADIIILDKRLNLNKTIIDGEIVWKKEK